MKIQSASVLVLLAGLALPASAETFIMKDGTTVEGAILRQDDTSYVVEIQVTNSIKDERIIAKADVERVKESKPDLAAFKEIERLVPAPDALSPEGYADRIAAVEKFIKDHRGSFKTPDARKILATLKSEANEILAGGVKVNGKVIAQPEYAANAYDIDSRIEAARIKNLIDAASYLEALRAFSRFDRDFLNTSAHTELVPLITRVIRTYVAGVAHSLATFDDRVKKRQVGLERMTLEDRRVSEKAIAEENVVIEKRLSAEKTARVGWVTTHPFLKASLEETVNFGKTELTRLENQSKMPGVDGGKIYREALSLIKGKSEQTAVTTALAAARTAQLPQRYLDTLQDAAKSGGFTP